MLTHIFAKDQTSWPRHKFLFLLVLVVTPGIGESLLLSLCPDIISNKLRGPDVVLRSNPG